jgi:hypothetical protein
MELSDLVADLCAFRVEENMGSRNSYVRERGAMG